MWFLWSCSCIWVPDRTLPCPCVPCASWQCKTQQHGREITAHRLARVVWGHVGEREVCQEPPKRFERGVSLSEWSVWAYGYLLQAWMFFLRGTDWRPLLLCRPVRERENRDATCCSRREGNQQATGFLQTLIIVSLLSRLSNPMATLSKSELQGQIREGARDQTEPLLVHRTPILY